VCINDLLDLDAEFYDQPIIAHRDKRLVSCSGELVRLGRTIILKNLTSFKVAPAFDPLIPRNPARFSRIAKNSPLRPVSVSTIRLRLANAQ
jgi:hypothetical protein